MSRFGGRRWRFLVVALVGLILVGVTWLVAFSPLPVHIHNIAAHNSKVLCSAVFISGRELEEARVNSVRVQLPGDRIELGDRRVSYSSLGVTRSSVYAGDQGCVALPAGSDRPLFPPVEVVADPVAPTLERRLDPGLQAEIEGVVESTGRHAAVLVVQGGEVIAEAYAPTFGAKTRFESWSNFKIKT